MTAVPYQPAAYRQCLREALGFARLFGAGLFVTLIASLVLSATSHANDTPAAQPVVAGDYIVAGNAGMGFGLLEPSFGKVVRRAAPIAAAPADAVALRGDINEDTVQLLAAAIRRGQREFVITSRGGEFLAAREMAELINDTGSTLVAAGQCHSSCAYLWLAVQKRRLGQAANLALHATYRTDGITNHGELWLREMGRPDLAKWAQSADMHVLSMQELFL